MHLPLHRRSTKRAGSPPKAAPSPPETSSTSETAVDSLPHDSQSATAPAPAPQPETPSHGHGLKGLSRRMASFSKPVRMLKTMTSRPSIRNNGKEAGHGRVVSMSAASMRSSVSQYEHEASSTHEQEHEPNVKEERESVDTDYGREMRRRSVAQMESSTASAPGQEKVGDKDKGATKGDQAAQAVENAVHEAAARQRPDVGAVKRAESKQESVTRVEQAADTRNEQAAPTAGAAIETVVNDAKDSKHVAIDTEKTTRDPKEAGVGNQPLTAPRTEPGLGESAVIVPRVPRTTSLSSSSIPIGPPAGNIVLPNGDAVKQVKMEEPEQLKRDGADVNPFLVHNPEPESQKEVTNSPAATNVESVVLSKELVPVAEERQSAHPPPPDKSVPAPSENASSPMSSSEDEAPELHAPALTVTSLFLPVPQTDPLSALLTKYVPEPHLRPPRDTSGEWQHTDFHTLVMTNNWRALAQMARDRIVAASPRDVELVLNLWYIRLSSLARLRLFNQASAECENLFSVLATIEPPTARAYILRNVLPFELEVLRARCAYWSGDHLGYLDDVSALLHRCRLRARQARDTAERAMWKERGARMALIVAGQLVEMKDYTAAATLLEPLSSSGSSPPSPALRSAIARIYLQGGNLSAAAELFDLVDADPDAEPTLKAMNAVVRSAAEGDWSRAAEYARGLAEGEAEDVVAANNYAVVLLGQGRIKEAIQVLETTLQASPSAATTTEPYLFNLSTMYELRAGLTSYRKRDLLIEVAKWSGDGLRTACLKMNA